MDSVKVEAFRSARIIVTIQVGSQRYKALQLFFGRDRSLFVNFPYFKHRAGIVAAATIPGNRQTSSQVNLQGWRQNRISFAEILAPSRWTRSFLTGR